MSGYAELWQRFHKARKALMAEAPAGFVSNDGIWLVCPHCRQPVTEYHELDGHTVRSVEKVGDDVVTIAWVETSVADGADGPLVHTRGLDHSAGCFEYFRLPEGVEVDWT